jgi:outer membrane lipase/esterase
MKRWTITALVLACSLAACGGGGNSGETKQTITSVKVVGASLADMGVFGYKFTVQPASAGTSYLVYSERIASTYGVKGFCKAYTFDGSSAFTQNAGCTNFAVAGASVHNYVSGLGAEVTAVPTSVIKQLTDAGAAGYGANDLLIVGEASSNDAAALATAFLTTAAATAQGQSNSAYPALLLSLLGSTDTQALLNADPTGAAAGVAYMKAVASKLTEAVKASGLSKGAQRVAVLNTLDVTRTPKFVAVLAGIKATQGQAAATEVQTLVRAWVQAYNTQLAANVAALGGKVVVVDLYQGFNDELDAPAQYGLINTTTTVCDEIVNAGATPGVTALSTPSVAAACTDAAASSITPSTGSDGTNQWWQKALFADNFHPTPYGHQLLGQLVAKRLSEAGWL